MRQNNIISLCLIVWMLLLAAPASLSATEGIDKRLQLTEAELAWLKDHPVITVANEPDYAPFDFIENGQPAGYSIDYLALLSELLGIEFHYKQATWNELVEMGKKKELDLLHTIFKTKKRQDYFLFTRPYKIITNGIYTNTDVRGINSVSDLRGRTVVIPKGDILSEFLPDHIPEATYIYRDTYVDILKAIELGNAEATILPSAVANYLIRRYTLSSVVSSAEADVPITGMDNKYRLAVRNDWPIFVSILEKAMDSIASDDLARLEARWLVLPASPEKSVLNLTLKEKAWIKEHPEIRVHNETDWAPFNFNDNGKPKGLSIDYMNLLSKKTGIRVNYISGPSWGEFLDMIRKKELDVMLNIVKTEDRQKYILFTDPYVENPNVIVSSKENRYERIDQLFGKTVSFPKGFFYEEVLTKNYPQIVRLPVRDTYESLKVVSFGKADAALGESAVLNFLINKHMLTDLAVSGEVNIGNPDLVNLRIGVRDDRPILHSILIKAMEAVTFQEMNRLRQKWILLKEASGIQADLLTEEEKKWLSKRGKIRIGIDPNYPPFEFIDEDNLYSGIGADYLKIITERLGMDVEIIPFTSWHGVLEGAKNKTIDILPTAFMTEERKKYLDFTKPYANFPIVILTRDDYPFIASIGDFKGKRLSLVESYAVTDLVLDKYSSIETEIFKTPLEALKAVSNGVNDGAIMNLAVGSYLIRKHNISNVKVAAPAGLDLPGLSIAVRKDWPELTGMLNRALESITLSEENIIRAKWFNLNFEKGIDIKRLRIIGLQVGSVVGVIFLLFLLWNRRLKREIVHRKRTEIDLHQARIDAEAANRAKSEFLATMSHEIRTPMNAIIGMTYLALKTQLSPKQQDYINKINEASNSLLVIINDILDFSKIEAGKLEIEKIDFKLDDILHKLSDIMLARAQEKGLELLFDIQQDIPVLLKGDPHRLNQILINLVNNAIKFTEKGDIVVATKAVDRSNGRVCLEFSVSDTGIGMTEDQMTELFKPFTQADTSTTRKFGGTGLGLTISKRLVEMMDGDIWAKSEQGKGSTFFFTVTFQLSDAKKGALSNVIPLEIQGMRVLIVDDNENSRVILQKILGSFHIKTSLAKSGGEALGLLESASSDMPFKVVIVDWLLPEMDGLELSRRIKSHSKLTYIPAIIMISSHSSEEIQLDSHVMEIDGFLHKPVTQSVMYDAIISALKKDSTRWSMQRSAKRESSPGFRGLKILLAEDNEINQQVARELLESMGAEVCIAWNGKEAADMVNISNYDCLLMDVNMPQMDGYTSTKAIRKDERHKYLLIIAMTANAMSGDREKCLDAGMNDYLSKPIDPNELIMVLEKWIGPMEGRISLSRRSQTTGGFPELTGIDVDSGLDRIGGDYEAYRSLLIKFYKNHDHALDEIKMNLKKGDTQKSESLVHTLKGVSGNIGANSLYRALEDLDSALKTGGSIPDNLFEQTEERLKEVLSSISTLTVKGETEDTVNGDVMASDKRSEEDTAKLERYFYELATLIEDSDTDSEQYLEEINAYLSLHVRPRELKELEKKLSLYDYKGAMETLTGIVKGINIR